MKEEYEGFPDLDAAFEAVKGVLFGPLDVGFVKHKFNQIVRDERERRDLEMSPRGLVGLAQHERDTRERKDRDHQTITLTALLASNPAYRAAWENAMDGLPELGAAMDDFQEKIDAALREAKAALKADLQRVAAQLPDGRYVFKGADGSIVDENLKALEGEDAKVAETLDYTGKMTLEDYRARKGEVDGLQTMADENRRDRAEVAGIHAELTNKEDPPQTQERVEGLGANKEAAKDRFEERVQKFDSLRAETSARMDEEAAVSATVQPEVGAMAVLKLS